MWSRLLLVPAIAGCAQLAGLDETSGDGREPVSLAFERVSIGATVVRAPADLTGHTATYLLEDPADPTSVTRFPAEQVATDTWSAQLFQPAPVLFDLPEPVVVQRHWDLDQRAITGSIVVFEHP